MLSKWLDTIVDMKNVREYYNFLAIQDIGLQPHESAYLNELRIINEYYAYMEEDEFL